MFILVQYLTAFSPQHIESIVQTTMSTTADDGTPLPVAEEGDSGNGLVCEEEFIAIKKSHMDELLNHTRLQTESMSNMIQMMKGMQGEIKQLTEKCNGMEKTMQQTKDKCIQMEKSIHTMHNKQSTMISRFDLVENKLNYHEVLTKNQQWKYSAPRPAEEYWEDIWDEDNEDEAENFLAQIKIETKEMRFPTDNCYNISLNAELPYNEEFWPHWDEFANALKQYQYFLKCLPDDNKSSLSLCGMELPNEVMDLLSNALESTHFHKFVLQNNNSEEDDIINFALNYLQSNQIMEEFTLTNNPFDSMKDIKRLCRIVKQHSSIGALTLSGCGANGGINTYQMLRSIMTAGSNRLTYIDLSNNGIRTGGGTYISDFLARNSVLENLHLYYNDLDDNDAMAIASSLKHNKTLCYLGLQRNDISSVGWFALRCAIFDDTSLNAAANSNHTCCVDFPSNNDDDEDQFQEVIEMNDSGDSEYYFDTKYVRQKKVYSILSSRNRNCCNAEYLEDVPFELLPDMLISIQQYSKYHVRENTPIRNSGDVKPLSIVYEICRYWDESLAAYESLST